MKTQIPSILLLLLVCTAKSYAQNNVGIGTTSPTAQLHTTGTLRLQNYPSQLLATDANGNITAATISATPNIYTANGSLTGGRTVTIGSNTLYFSNGASSVSMYHTATIGNMGIAATNRSNFRLDAGSGASNSVLGIYQDVSSAGQITVSGASTQLMIGSSTGATAPVSLMTGGVVAFTVINGGNVGIGTQNPSTQLHTTGTVRLANYPGQILATDASGNITTATTATTPNIYTANGSLIGNRTVTQGASTLAFTSTALNGFSVDGTTFSVDAANHRVGMGTAAPGSYLSVINGGGSGVTSIADISNTWAGNTTDALTIGINNCGGACGQSMARNIVLYNANGTNSSFSTIDFVPSTTSTGISGASIRGIDRDATNGYAGLSFDTRNAIDYDSRMVIKSSGNVGIGTATPTTKLQVVGIPAYNNDAAAGAAGLTSGAFWQTSSTNTIGLPRGVLMVKQ